MDLASHIIGIDLGTTYSCVAVVKHYTSEHPQVEVLIDPDSGTLPTPLVPSCVSFLREGGHVVGHSALRERLNNLGNTVYDMKRIIGRSYKSLIMENLIDQNWPFQIIDDPNHQNQPIVQLATPTNNNNSSMQVRPVEISAKVLRKLRLNAEDRLQIKVTEAVITVPARFDPAQKEATMEAAYLSGLSTVHLITEPAAAAFAFGYDKAEYYGYTLLVFDLGGGTFDTSIVKINKGEGQDKRVFKVEAFAGDPKLGGRDFDNALFELCSLKVAEQCGGDCKSSPRIRQMLAMKCEELKKQLSMFDEASIDVANMFPNLEEEGVDTEVTVTRQEFEDVCMKMFKKAIGVTQQMLLDIEPPMQPEDVDEILLVGGSTRIPKIQQMLRDMFPSKQLKENVNADEAVAHGAALRGLQMITTDNNGQANEDAHDLPSSQLELVETVSLSIGVRVNDELFEPILRRNTPIPTEKMRTYSTGTNNQETLTFEIYEGERPMVKMNKYLGKFTLNGLSRGMAGSVRVQLTMRLDSNGILHMTAMHNSLVAKSEINYYAEQSGGVEKEKANEKILADAELFKEQDQRASSCARAKSNLRLRLERLKYQLDEPTLLTVPAAIKAHQQAVLASYTTWLAENQSVSEEVYRSTLTQLDLDYSSRKRVHIAAEGCGDEDADEENWPES